MKGHAEHDAQAYVNPDELAAWRERDPLRRLESALEASGALPAPERRLLHDEVERQLDADVAFAEASPFPDPALAFQGVYADEGILERAREGVFTGGW
jgi:pyruvate dehydrogenase E1 component alpha subunit